MVSPVVLSMLVFTVILTVPTGLLALHYNTLRGGSSNPGSVCGTFCINLYNNYNFTSWGTGAALSLLFVVVILVLVLIVAFSVLFFFTVLALHTGSVALPYHLNQSLIYSLRGGYSGSGTDCGVFSVRLNIGFSITRWNYSAALSFYLRGGASHRGAYCGVFFVAVWDGFSTSGWSVGAAL